MIITTLQKLKDLSIVIDGSTMAYRPNENKKVLFNPSVEPKMERCFCSNAGIIAFVIDGKMYVIPYMASVMSVLSDEGFERKPMYVPFSNEEYPIGQKDKWEALKRMAVTERKERFTSDCNNFSDKHGYGPIAQHLLKEFCLEIPEDGVHYIKFQNSDVYYPVVSGTSFSNSVANSIGKYCIDKGVCTFVYRDGKTYVTKNSKVISALQSAGYMLGNLRVPFTNGEIITDSPQAEIWKRIA